MSDDDNDQRWSGVSADGEDGSTRQGCGGNEKTDRYTKRGKERERTKAVIRGSEVSEQGMLVPNEIGSFWPCRTTFGFYSTRLSPFLILDEAHSTSPSHRNRPRRCRSSITGDARFELPAILRNSAIYIYSARVEIFIFSAARRGESLPLPRCDRKDSSMICVLLSERNARCNKWKYLRQFVDLIHVN